MGKPRVKDNFRAGEPVSKSWYNEVAKRVNEPSELEGVLKDIQGYNAGQVQALVNVSGVLKWVTVATCD